MAEPIVSQFERDSCGPKEPHIRCQFQFSLVRGTLGFSGGLAVSGKVVCSEITFSNLVCLLQKTTTINRSINQSISQVINVWNETA